ncbi:MAG: mechanosensitive ion channel family protein, partial [Acidimicrobiia bacterium]
VNDALDKAGEDLQEDSRVGGLVMEPPSVLGVENLTESKVTVRVAINTAPGRHARVARAYRQLVKQKFDEDGIASAA